MRKKKLARKAWTQTMQKQYVRENAKEGAYCLRHQRRQMKALHAKTWYGEMSWQQQQQYTKWWSGEMEQEHFGGRLCSPLVKKTMLIDKHPARGPQTVYVPLAPPVPVPSQPMHHRS